MFLKGVPESSVGRIGKEVSGGLEIIRETLLTRWRKVCVRGADNEENLCLY